MEKKYIALTVILSVLAASLLLWLGGSLKSPSSSGGVAVTVNSQPGGSVIVKDSGKEQVLGAGVSTPDQVTVLTALQTTGDSYVSGTASFSGAVQASQSVAFSGSSTFSGSSFFTGDAQGSVMGAVSSTMSTATTTPCAILNSSGRTRIMTGIGYLYTSSTSGGTFAVTAGTSTDAFTTSTSPFINAGVGKTLPGRDLGTTTSTFIGSSAAYGEWRNNEYLVYKATTSVNAGICWASYH